MSTGAPVPALASCARDDGRSPRPAQSAARAGRRGRYTGPAGGHPMRIVVAPDSFKGALTGAQAAAAIADGLRDIRADAEAVPRPMADGGEGTVDALLTALGGRRETATVRDPLGRPVEAAWGRVPDRRLAVIEMAAASGLPLLADAERDPAR